MDPRRAYLPFAEWPVRDRRRWAAVRAPLVAGRFSERSAATKLSPRSLEKFQGGYARWLGFLGYMGWLHAEAAPGARATRERLAAYFDLLVQLENRPYTILGRFQELARALSLLEPGICFRHVTHPGGRPLREMLDLRSRDQEIHHPADLLLWGTELMEGAMSRPPRRRQVQMRDGLLIAMLAFRGLRLRSVVSLTLGGSVRRDGPDDPWRLDIQGEDVKNARYILATLPRLLGPWIDRYVEVERAELLAGHKSDAFWINWGGEPLGQAGLDKRIRWLSAKRFGAGRAFGTHRFRYCISTTAPLLIPDQPALAAALLRITSRVMAEHYDRGDAVLAFKAFHKTLAAARHESETLARTSMDPAGQGALSFDTPSESE